MQSRRSRIPASHTDFSWFSSRRVPASHTDYSWGRHSHPLVGGSRGDAVSSDAIAGAAVGKSTGDAVSSDAITGSAGGGAPSTLLDRVARLEAAARVPQRISCTSDATWTNDTDSVDSSREIERVVEALTALGCRGTALARVPSEYYDTPLLNRARLLHSAPRHLCKSVILENSLWRKVPQAKKPKGASAAPPADRWASSRFLCVVLQYVSKLDTDRLAAAMTMRLEEVQGTPFDYKLAEESDSDSLSGFRHNAVTPFGMLTSIPIVVVKAIQELDPPYLWLGGGEIDLKLRISTPQLIKSLDAIVVECSVPR